MRALPVTPPFLEDFALKSSIGNTHITSTTAKMARPAAELSKLGKGTRRRKANNTTPRGTRLVASHPAKEASSILAVIVGTVSNLGGNATADLPFLDAGIDSLGNFYVRAFTLGIVTSLTHNRIHRLQALFSCVMN